MINYENDFYGWTQEQAAFLRAGRLTDLDIENLIEEVETMGRSEKRELQSRLTILMAHLLKWEYQPQRASKSWLSTIEYQRNDCTDVIGDNPSLKPLLDSILAKAYTNACLLATKETGINKKVFHPSCPWTISQILDVDFLPEQQN